jgi:hypothetical protein
MNLDRVFGCGILLTLLIIVCLGVGYVMNIIKFCKLDFEQPVKAEVIRGVGIFPPFGAVIGWIPIKDGKVVEVIRE